MTKPLPESLNELRMLTMKQVCELTSYCPQHIYRLERLGRFPKRVRMGANRICYRFTDVQAWLQARQPVNPANDNIPAKG